MADLSKIKRRSTLGAPPPMEEASQNLDAPEIAPALEPPSGNGTPAKVAAPPAAVTNVAPPAHDPLTRIDGRTLRRTDRTVPFASRVTPQFDVELRRIAVRDGLKLVEVLEKALTAYEAQRKRR